MKRLKFLLFMSFTTLLHISCQEDGGQDPSVIGCPKGKVCFELNGAEKQVDAVWYDINGQRTRVYYESGSGDSYENIEIDFYGSSPGNYSFVDQNWGAGDASFHYFRAGGTGGASGTSGTLEITAVGSTVSGSFSLSGVDSEGNSVQLTNGFINQVPAE